MTTLSRLAVARRCNVAARVVRAWTRCPDWRFGAGPWDESLLPDIKQWGENRHIIRSNAPPAPKLCCYQCKAELGDLLYFGQPAGHCPTQLCYDCWAGEWATRRNRRIIRTMRPEMSDADIAIVSDRMAGWSEQGAADRHGVTRYRVRFLTALFRTRPDTTRPDETRRDKTSEFFRTAFSSRLSTTGRGRISQDETRPDQASDLSGERNGQRTNAGGTRDAG